MNQISFRKEKDSIIVTLVPNDVMSETQADDLRKRSRDHFIRFSLYAIIAQSKQTLSRIKCLSCIQRSSDAKVLFVIRGKPDTLINTHSTEYTLHRDMSGVQCLSDIERRMNFITMIALL